MGFPCFQFSSNLSAHRFPARTAIDRQGVIPAACAELEWRRQGALFFFRRLYRASRTERHGDKKANGGGGITKARIFRQCGASASSAHTLVPPHGCATAFAQPNQDFSEGPFKSGTGSPSGRSASTASTIRISRSGWRRMAWSDGLPLRLQPRILYPTHQPANAPTVLSSNAV